MPHKIHYLIAGLITELGALSGPSVFLCATDSGNVNVVALLLANGANPNPHGPNPLISACYRGHYDVARLLLEHGADPNANGNNYGNGTSLSAATGYPKLIELLRSYGAKE